MSNGHSTGAGLVNLETELTCSICTDILYQPLTLLDCLHTFCGSCLKEWVSWQESHPPSSSRNIKFTCPSCRAVIRDTRHDAKVTTLLDLFLQSNPHRARGAGERKELERKYKPGDTILPARPAISSRVSDSEEEEDLRLLAEVREMSLGDVDQRRARVSSSSRTSQPRSRDQISGTRGLDRQEEAQRRRRNARRAASQQRTSPDPATSTRRIEHQASLRSLLSTSDGDSAMEEEILRQIIDEGLLDGIDLQSLDPAQEDELSERIAEAYRRRHLRQPIPRHNVRGDGDNRSRDPRSRQSRSNSVDVRPPVTRSHLLEAPSQRTDSSNRQQRSSSDQGVRRRATSPTHRTAASSSDALIQPAVRSSSDLSGQRRPSQNNSTSESFRHRTASSLSSSRRSGESERRVRQSGVRSADRQQIFGSPNSTSSATTPSTQATSSSQLSPASQPAATPQLGGRNHPTDQRDTVVLPSSRPSSSRSETAVRTGESLIPEPSISCRRCNQRDIQYDVYKTCNRCNDGNYNLCLPCHRMGRGCLHWFGFGHSAQARFEKKYPAGSSDVPEPPHVLQSRKYLRPSVEATQNRPNSSRRRTKDDPAKRLQRGMFCDMCQSFSDDCFWTCSECNGGEWGFCNSCVNQGKCCTHALLPIGRVLQGDIVPDHPASSSPVVTSDYVSANTIKVGSDSYRPLTFSTKCNNCTYPIPPSTSRFHCPTCNDGDYDLCTNCYLKLGANGKISKGNGRNGWRRCLQGHRMIIVGFEDHPDGQRRAIVKDVVGGHALKDDVAVAETAAAAATPTTSENASTTPNSNGPVAVPVRRDSGDWTWKEESSGTTSITHRRRFPRTRTAWSNSSPTSPADPSANTPFSSHFPPSGGVGLRLLARWSYYPEPDVTDEIMFPFGAEITEADNINDDWMWGCYAGQKGLFPGSYVVVIGEVRLE
ncbi:RING finger domain-containing protein [Histoplasma capsulatum G186AR]|uniref:RING finger domain-containing protein n=1 Tax=Ajellomyces capsulatus TaxID=5037 RepID=A0A8H7Z4A1_AJECA|nr:RING finger domain-containing protein [Histoplasma capsulatum]QSS72074.1 RING finger domain-containing protein [Histoplasma capsulatum G186AR]